jgi:hypothetical protein
MASGVLAADAPVAAWVDSLQAAGRYTFTHHDLRQLAGRSAVAIAAALQRLKRKGRIQTPRRGFFVIVPVEYRNAGCPQGEGGAVPYASLTPDRVPYL